MTKWLLLALLAVWTVPPTLAQGAADACGGGRYADNVFTGVNKTTAITYGYNSTIDYTTGGTMPVTLQLDFYEPAGDAATQRPLVIFAFGGSFVSGQRQDMDDLCQALARKGYATATIDYRLVQPGANGANYYAVAQNRAYLADEVVRASSDMKAAVRFFRHDAATYRIDPAAIFVAGYSAGAITALQTAYLDSETEDPTFTQAYQDNGGLEGNTDLPPPNSLLPTYNARDLRGTFSLAGGLASPAVLSAGNPPLYSVHGDADQVVPYDQGTIQSTSYTLYGSHALQAQAASVGVASQLYTIAGGDHGSPRRDPDRTASLEAAARFFQGLLCPAAPLPVTLVAFQGRLNPATCQATLSWRTASETSSAAYEVEQSADGRTFAPIGAEPSRNSPTGASYQFATGPLAGPAYFRLKMRDANNQFTYSPVVALAAGCGAATELRAAPNPATEQVCLSGLPAGPCQVRLYEATGRLLREATVEENGTLVLAGLPAGLYLLQARTTTGQPAGQLRLLKQ